MYSYLSVCYKGIRTCWFAHHATFPSSMLYEPFTLSVHRVSLARARHVTYVCYSVCYTSRSPTHGPGRHTTRQQQAVRAGDTWCLRIAASTSCPGRSRRGGARSGVLRPITHRQDSATNGGVRDPHRTAPARPHGGFRAARCA
eukprot:122282-Prymnesium_polylepis.1